MWDVVAAVDFLATRPEVDSQRVGLIGHSMGAAVVIRAAARLPAVAAVVVENAFTSLEDNIGQGVERLTGLPPFPFAPLVVWFGEWETGMDIRQVRPIDDLAGITPRPILIMHGSADPIIDVRNAFQLYQAAHQPKELLIITTDRHGGLLEADPAGFEQRVVSFLDRHLRARAIGGETYAGESP